MAWPCSPVLALGGLLYRQHSFAGPQGHPPESGLSNATVLRDPREADSGRLSSAGLSLPVSCLCSQATWGATATSTCPRTNSSVGLGGPSRPCSPGVSETLGAPHASGQGPAVPEADPGQGSESKQRARDVIPRKR